MAASDIVEAFKRLSPSRSRAAVLDGIIAELTPYEWRDALKKLQKRPFLFDIVASLPAEIIIHIFSYLDVLTPFRLQRVSKRWRVVLTSPEILQALLSTWYSKGDQPLKGEASLKGQEYAICKLKAEHLHRFQTGRPYSDIHMPISDGQPWRISYTAMGDHPSADFCKDTVAWIDNASGTDIVKACNLRTGKHIAVAGNGRESIQFITLTDELLVISTYSTLCYACDLTTGEKRSFRLPSTHDMQWSCRGRSVGGIIRNRNLSLGTTAFVWNFDSRNCKAFEIQNPTVTLRNSSEWLSARAVLINPPSETMLICWSIDTETETIIHFSRYTYAGKKSQEDRVHRIEYRVPPWRLQAINGCGGFRLCTLSKERQETPLIFTELSDKFEECKSNVKLQGLRDMLWKDSIYRLDFGKNGDKLQVHCRGTRDAPMARPLEFHRSQTYWPQNTAGACLFLNDVFVVLFGVDSMHIWCFDKDINLPRDELKALHRQKKASIS